MPRFCTKTCLPSTQQPRHAQKVLSSTSRCPMPTSRTSQETEFRDRAVLHVRDDARACESHSPLTVFIADVLVHAACCFARYSCHTGSKTAFALVAGCVRVTLLQWQDTPKPAFSRVFVNSNIARTGIVPSGQRHGSSWRIRVCCGKWKKICPLGR